MPCYNAFYLPLSAHPTAESRLKDQGVTFATEVDESTSGPASFVVVDPDGNSILVDQHR